MFNKRKLFLPTALITAVGAGILTWGALVDADKIQVDTYHLKLPGWPERLDGFRLVVLSDFHIEGESSGARALRAVEMALDQSPDMLALCGDFVSFWEAPYIDYLIKALEPVVLLQGKAVAITGNHDYLNGHISMLADICETLDIRLLQNEVWRHQGITWVGINSFVAYESNLDFVKPEDLEQRPVVVLWHEPDAVDFLPFRGELMVSGHSHGGQFTFPWGWTPQHSYFGAKYPRGFYPDTPTPLFTSRGIGTTAFPSRLNCPPEVAVLVLHAA